MSGHRIERLPAVESNPTIYTVAAAQDMIKLLRNDGVICPCCDQLVKVYHRKFNVIMARGLVWMYFWVCHTDQLWVHVNTLGPDWLVRQGGTFALMKFWGFIVERPNDDSRKRCAGYWRLTTDGIAAITERRPFPAYAYLLNGQKIAMSDEQTDIKKALGVKFNYEELMRTRGGLAQ